MASSTITPFVRSPGTRLTFLFILNLLLSLSVCAPQTLFASPTDSGDEFLVVDCLLPGTIRKLGRQVTYLTPRRPIKTSARDCEIRGGEYVAYDRSDYKTALKVWLEEAEKGDAVAQTYVGEIYEKGLGTQPDYVLAAQWYRKAAEQGYARAQTNLGQLYEKGLGVEKDPVTALNWYRKASGLSQAIAIDTGQEEKLREEVERSKRESESLRQQLEQTQKQLEQARKELARRKNEVETERQKLEKAQQELERQKQQAKAAGEDAELEKLEEQLKQREANLERQRQEMTRLRQEKDQLETEAEIHRKELAKLNEQKGKAATAGPTIEMIDPLLLVTRGVAPRVKTQTGIERVIVGRVTAPAGLLTFTFNDREEKLDTNGMFRLKTPVQRSNVPVKLVAVDKQEKRATVEFLLTPEVEAKPSPSISKERVLPTIDFGEYYALIIGNKEYTYWPRLETPGNDATETAKVLREKYGFKTEVLLNATRLDIIQALDRYRKKLTEKDNLLIYYAGHGYLDDKTGCEYWVPVDGKRDGDLQPITGEACVKRDSPANWISTSVIADFLGGMPAKHVLVVADSCYSGTLTRSAIARPAADISEEARYQWFKTTSKKRSRIVLSSGDLQPVLDTGGGEHSIFAKAFLEILVKNNEIIEGQSLYSQVSVRVAYAADVLKVEQNPQYAPIKYAGHESGDFLFVPQR